MPLKNLLLLTAAAMVSLLCYAKAEHQQYTRLLDYAMGLVEDQYVEPVQSRQLYEGAMAGLVNKLDPYSQYIPPADYQQFEEELNQKFGGIGILVEAKTDTNQILVMSPLVGTPAWEAGLRAGDVILKIDDLEVDGVPFPQAVEHMRGAPGTKVKLVVQRPGESEPSELDIERRVIQVESVLGDFRSADGGWNFYLEDHPEIAYIRVLQFGDRTTEELKKALVQVQDKKGLILDLRGNPGGLLECAREVCDMFLDEGDIVSIRGRGGELARAYTATSGTSFPRTTPMVVLVNKYSASASEIVAACLQDDKRAAVIGVRSWGKGSVQNVFEMEGGRSALKLTTASYWRPSNHNIHRLPNAKEEDEWGVKPDPGLEVKLTPAEEEKLVELRRQRDVAGAKPKAEPAAPPADKPPVDAQLQKAIEYLQARE